MSQKLIDRLRGAAEAIFHPFPIALAYLHGSQASGQTTPLSDVDVAVVTAGVLPPRERLRLELSLETTLGALLGREADVRVINQAPLAVRGKVVQTGILLYARDDAVRIDFETTVRAAYFDFLPVLRFHRRAYLDSQRAALAKRGLQ